ncbi:13772_t:CDS:2, partial [Racocetra fulgida]
DILTVDEILAFALQPGRSSQNGNGVLRSSISLDVHDLMKTRDATLLNAFNEESLGLTQLNDISDSEEG